MVALLTAGGLKDPDATARVLGAAPGLANADLDTACRALKDHYGFDPHG